MCPFMSAGHLHGGVWFFRGHGAERASGRRWHGDKKRLVGSSERMVEWRRWVTGDWRRNRVAPACTCARRRLPFGFESEYEMRPKQRVVVCVEERIPQRDSGLWTESRCWFSTIHRDILLSFLCFCCRVRVAWVCFSWSTMRGYLTGSQKEGGVWKIFLCVCVCVCACTKDCDHHAALL